MLYRTPDLDDADLRTLDEVEVMRQELRLLLSSTRRWTTQLRRNLTARAPFARPSAGQLSRLSTRTAADA
ncbi:hypothetical protein HRW07_12445 [Streptomyces lunaelactis]|uniref:hypothetical protein n=1 Tax=Streptomyces lunaelactis TaxID=1535768 RepID=UPI001584C353|nr:hypothetical protein [Streptomyces lunaelactis]NUL04033.1 hypothetical protein [Streptomyces lunaelactis]